MSFHVAGSYQMIIEAKSRRLLERCIAPAWRYSAPLSVYVHIRPHLDFDRDLQLALVGTKNPFSPFDFDLASLLTGLFEGEPRDRAAAVRV